MKKNNFQTTWIGLLMLCIFGLSMQAQTGNVTLGSGTSVSGDGTGTSPVNGAYRNFRYQTVYTKAEIIAAGGAAGNITQMGWRVSSTISGLTNYTIRMGHTTATTLSSHIATTTNQVYSVATYSPVGSSINYSMVTLTTPFNWNGSDNIVVEVCYSRATTTTSGGGVYTYSATSPGCKYVGNSSATPTLCSTNTASNGFSSKPQIRFVMSLTPTATCDAPENLASSSVTGTTATISWDAVTGAASGYETYHSTAATAPTGAGTATTSLSRSLTGLLPGTTYHFWVRSKCGATSFSDWTKSSFSTPCVAPTVSNATAGTPACMSGSVNLTATASAGNLYWFDAATNGNLVGTGTNFQTPVMSASTNYYVGAGQALASDIDATVGNGALTSTSTTLAGTPFYVYGSQKTQYIIKASELYKAGIGAGNINSLALEVTAVGNSSLSNFNLSLGSTAQTAATTSFVGNLTSVYSSAAQTMTVGTNTYTFSTAFNWNGTSNLVVQICWNNGNAGTAVNNVKYDNTDFVSQTNLYTVSPTASVSCTTTIGSGTTSARPKFIINGKGICMSASRQMVTALVKTNGKNFYDDTDGDGYGNPATAVFLCEDTVAGKVTNGTDCDDDNINVYRTVNLYADADGDGYTVGALAPVCYGASIPTGYSATSLGNDCDDTNDEIHTIFSFYVDADQDGYGAGSLVPVCAAHANTPPFGYSLTNDDCTDDNKFVNPGMAEIFYNGIDDNCDGDIDEGRKITSQLVAGRCGTTLTKIYHSVNCDFRIAGVTGYRFKVTNQSNNDVQTIERPNAYFSFNQLQRFDYGTAYTVQVEVQRNNIWLGYYGAGCTVTTPDVAKLAICGGTVATKGTFVNSEVLLHATAYRFEVTNTVTNQMTPIDNGRHSFTFNEIAGFTPGGVYSVKVSVKTTGDWSAFGASCLITAPDGTGPEIPTDKAVLTTTTAFSAVASPNPFAGSFNLNVTTSLNDNVNIKVYDMLGKLVENREVNATEIAEQQLGNHYPSGVYNIVVTQGENLKTLRVVKR